MVWLDNSGIVIPVERSTRYVLLGWLPGTRDSATVTVVWQDMIEDSAAGSDTHHHLDQRQEMASHGRVRCVHRRHGARCSSVIRTRRSNAGPTRTPMD